jgi:hypothetical protein
MSNQRYTLFPIIFQRRIKISGIKTPDVALIHTMIKWTCIFILGLCGIASAEPIVFQSQVCQTTLLELYTSEGCSSCPPAEAWLSNLKIKPGLWTDYLPVAFHVDYWNNLGWRDRLSSEEYTQRQNDYAQSWSAQEIYTPEFVLNGKEWSNWFGYRSIPSPATINVGTLRVSSLDGKHWQAFFAPVKNSTADYEVTAALLVSDLGSDVTAGENSGRRLDHDFAILSLITRPLANQTNGIQGGFIIDNHPKDITGRLALAAWVTRSGHLEPLQATGGWLPTPPETNLSPIQTK